MHAQERQSCRKWPFLAGLTPSLPQPLKFPGWMMHGRACKRYIFRSYNIYFPVLFSTLCILMKILSRARAKKKTKRLKGLKFRTVWVFFKWHHGTVKLVIPVCKKCKTLMGRNNTSSTNSLTGKGSTLCGRNVMPDAYSGSQPPGLGACHHWQVPRRPGGRKTTTSVDLCDVCVSRHSLGAVWESR